MSQFSVYRNANQDSKNSTPFLLDVQSDLIADLNTRVVIPLLPINTMQGKLIKLLTPVIAINDQKYVAVTPHMAGVPKKLIGEKVADISYMRDDIIAAIDLLITGI